MADSDVQTMRLGPTAVQPKATPNSRRPSAFRYRLEHPQARAVIDMATSFDVPAEGVVPYKYFVVPSKFTEDNWVQAAEIRPDHRAVIYYVIVFIQDPNAPPRESANLAACW